MRFCDGEEREREHGGVLDMVRRDNDGETPEEMLDI